MDAQINNQQSPHLSVLYHEIILALRPHSTGKYVDATIGAGGHSWGILEASAPSGILLGMDLDPQALDLAHKRLTIYNNRLTLVQASFTSIREQTNRLGWESVQGILVDLGVSSMQLDDPERGFSFSSVGPLDMRFNPEQKIKAADLVNHLPEAELADLLWRFGEEKHSRRIARSICNQRPIENTRELAALISHTVRGQRKRIHPATRAFQALRIAVNQELASLEDMLPEAVAVLAPGGRLAIISFHSLEDRLVKHYFRRESRDCICPPEQPVCTCQHHATILEVTRRPITPGEAEIQTNPRARSARLRIAEKIKLA